MTVALADFRAEFPEFNKADDVLVSAKLAMAARRIDTTVWGDLADDGTKLLTAHLLAISPFGQGARMANKEGGSTYGNEYEAMKRTVARGYGVCGMPTGWGSE